MEQRFDRIEQRLGYIQSAIMAGATLMATAILFLRGQIKTQNGRVTINEQKIRDIEDAMIEESATRRQLLDDTREIKTAVLKIQEDQKRYSDASIAASSTSKGRADLINFQVKLVSFVLGTGLLSLLLKVVFNVDF